MSLAKLTSALLKAEEVLEEDPVGPEFAVDEQALRVMALARMATINKNLRGVNMEDSNQKKMK